MSELQTSAVATSQHFINIHQTVPLCPANHVNIATGRCLRFRSKLADNVRIITTIILHCLR